MAPTSVEKARGLVLGLIANRELISGQHISVSALAKEYQLNKNVLGEAVQTLVEQKILTYFAGVGYFVGHHDRLPRVPLMRQSVKSPCVEATVELLAKDIDSGELQPGARLLQADVAKKYGVNKRIAAKAIRELMYLGKARNNGSNTPAYVCAQDDQ